MILRNANWIKLTSTFDEWLNDALLQQHHAAQFLAMVGRHLIPQEEDDSNTSMKYMIREKSLLGNPLKSGVQVELRLTDLILYFRNSQSTVNYTIALNGKTKQKVFYQLKQNLSELGLDTSHLTYELHYQLPDHRLEHGAEFKIEKKIYFQEVIACRHNAEIILSQLVQNLPAAGPIRVWPHHFDTGTIVPLTYDNEGKISKSIGLGWAIPDNMVNESYFYLGYWSKNPPNDFDQLPALPSGEWISSGWQGAVLKHSEILQFNKAQEQYEEVLAFFNSAIKVIHSHFKRP